MHNEGRADAPFVAMVLVPAEGRVLGVAPTGAGTDVGTRAADLFRSAPRWRILSGPLVLSKPRWSHSALPPLSDRKKISVLSSCLLYTSDAADDLLCVDLG